MSTLDYSLIILFCLVASAFFSSSETALLRITSEELERDFEKKGKPGTAAARELLKSSSRLLVTILLGNNVVNILAAACASSLAVVYLGPELGLLVSTVAMTILILVFAEVFPKAIAARNPSKVANIVSLPLYLVHKIIFPIHLIVDRVVDPFVRKFTGDMDTAEAQTSESVLRLARKMRHRKQDGSPISIIGSAARAAELTAAEIMIPRTEIIAFPSDIGVQELLKEMLNERYTRVPIYEDTLDKIKGLVHLKDLIYLSQRNDAQDLNSIIKPVLRVPERMPILRLLTEMQKVFIHMAIVKDEFEVTQGLLTQEDILEEIVGEIRDEFDREELMMIRKVGEGVYDVLGRVLVHDFARESGWEIKAQKGDTVGGLVFNTLGHHPKNDETIKNNGYLIRVLDVSGSRVIRVRISRMESEPTT